MQSDRLADRGKILSDKNITKGKTAVSTILSSGIVGGVSEVLKYLANEAGYDDVASAINYGSQMCEMIIGASGANDYNAIKEYEKRNK